MVFLELPKVPISHKEILPEVLAVLRLGELIALPSEFGYLFACDAINPFAIGRLKKARNDEGSNGYAILFVNKDQLVKFSTPISQGISEVLHYFWSDLLTLEICKSNQKWNVGDGGQSTTFFARSTSNPFICEILESFGPLAISSASAKGWPSFESPELIQEHFSSTISLVIGNGSIKPAAHTTVITESGEDIVVLREGAITNKSLREKLPDMNFLLPAEIS